MLAAPAHARHIDLPACLLRMLRARTPLQRPPSAAPPPPFPPRGRNSAELRLRGGRAGEGAGGRAGLVVVLPHGACGAAPLPGGRGRSGAA